MDNLTHSLFGWTLARAGAGRRVPRATATLVIASNIPDVADGEFLSDGSAFIYTTNAGALNRTALPANTTAPLQAKADGIMGFSPDGKYVLGVQGRDGVPDGYAIFDVATGDKVTEFSTPLSGIRVGQIAWDVDDTLLAVTQDGRSRDDAIVRFDLHGHATLATEPKPSSDTSFPIYRLPTRP